MEELYDTIRPSYHPRQLTLLQKVNISTITTRCHIFVLRSCNVAAAFFSIGLSSRLLLDTLSSSCFLDGVRGGKSAITDKKRAHRGWRFDYLH